jgi:uncharacterized protein YdaU (DUF1376 family)
LSKSPGFQFYVRDWLCSRRVLSMSGDAVKAYMYLLSESWLQTPRATLPTEDKDLASIARVSDEVWMRIKSEVLQHFKIGQCKEHKGLFFNEKLLEVSRKYEKNQRHDNKNAKRTRIEREKTRTVGSSIAFAFASSSSVEYEENIPPPLLTDEFKKCWLQWCIHRKQSKKKLTPMAAIKQLKYLGSIGESRAIAAIEHSIRNQWQGIYEPKENFFGKIQEAEPVRPERLPFPA